MATARKAAGEAAPLATEQGQSAFWREEIAKALKRFDIFHSDGDRVQTEYRNEHDNGNPRYRDRYNMLYSSTETMKPSLYTKTPKIEAVQRHKDRQNFKVVLATTIFEAVGQYCVEDMDFDTAAEAAIEDFLLPGLGQLWVRYEAVFDTVDEQNGQEKVSSEKVVVDHVYWKDFLTGMARTWPEVPWVARRIYFDKPKAGKRFGKKIADSLKYTFQAREDGNGNKEISGSGGAQAVVWEIWDKNSKKVLWVSNDYTEGFLDVKDDPLKLKDFFPCPQPIRAVKTNRTFVPKSFFSTYRQQAEAVNDITARIRHLTKALRVVGVYDKTQEELQRLLSGDDNRMVAVENWAQFQGQGGIKGVIDWVPIQEVATVLTELYRQREIAKAEIYEITGFADIVRGVSKASETLGAQEIKNEWAGGRLRAIQTRVQNFIRDTIRIVGEVAIENFDDVTIAMYCGFEPPEITPEEQQAIEQYGMQALTDPAIAQQPPPRTGRQEAVEQFKEAVQLLKNEKQRCALIGIETDSTIQPDEAQERKDRVEFLGQIGAFLQQAGPMALQYPDMRGLLGSIMMFVIHTFRSSRGVEKEFEEFAKKLAEAPPMAPPGSEGEGGGSDVAGAQAKVEGEKIKQQGEMQLQQNDLMMEKYKVDEQEKTKREKQIQDHEYRMAQLALEQHKLGVQQEKNIMDGQRADRQQEHTEAVAEDNAMRAEVEHSDSLSEAAEDRELARETAKSRAKPKD